MTTRAISIDFHSGDARERAAVPGRVQHLGYVARAPASRQPLYRGRLALEPDIDLADYTIRAEIDWIELGFATKGRHQALNIARSVNKALAQARWRDDCRVTGVARHMNYVGQVFLVRVNDPTPDKIRCVGEAVRSFCRLQQRRDGESFVITGIEISVDIRPDLKDPDEVSRALARWRMSELLRKHVAIRPTLLNTALDKPRYTVAERDEKKTIELVELPRKNLGKAQESIVQRLQCSALKPSKHHKPPLDATFYAGARDASVMLCLQDKTADSHDDGKGRTALPAERRRSRIEVRAWVPRPDESGLLMSGGLKEICADATGWPCALETLEDLRNVQFEKLRKPFFDFVIPTIPAAKGTSAVEPDRAHWAVFEKTGAFGLDLYQRALDKKDLGTKGYNEAYTELSDRMRKALVHLSRRWHGASFQRDASGKAA